MYIDPDGLKWYKPKGTETTFGPGDGDGDGVNYSFHCEKLGVAASN